MGGLAASPVDKAFGVLTSLGTLAAASERALAAAWECAVRGRPAVGWDATRPLLALSPLLPDTFCELVLEIEDTLRQPPPAAQTMRSAVNAGVGAATVVYLAVAVVSFLALGNGAPGFVFDGYVGMSGAQGGRLQEAGQAGGYCSETGACHA